jgi:hypothetical protein
MKATIKYKINGVIPLKEFNALAFGRQIEVFKQFEQFKASAKCVGVSQKRCTNASAIRDTIKLYNAKEFYCVFHDSPEYRDDGFDFWYK